MDSGSPAPETTWPSAFTTSRLDAVTSHQRKPNGKTRKRSLVPGMAAVKWLFTPANGTNCGALRRGYCLTSFTVFLREQTSFVTHTVQPRPQSQAGHLQIVPCDNTAYKPLQDRLAFSTPLHVAKALSFAGTQVSQHMQRLQRTFGTVQGRLSIDARVCGYLTRPLRAHLKHLALTSTAIAVR